MTKLICPKNGICDRAKYGKCTHAKVHEPIGIALIPVMSM